MKKHKSLPALPKRSIFKILLLMKFMVIFILLTNMQLAARPFSQDRITLNLQSAGLKTALKQIEKQTIFRFLYNDEVVSSTYKVSINAINKPVTEVLDNIFTTTTLTYRILENNLVVITGREQSIQDIRVTGKVTSSTGEIVPGVTVTIKGSTVTTTTNAAGIYSISAPETATLVFSSVGYATQEVPVNNRTELDVTLQTSTVGLNEVVVIGYGTANKRDLTGSIVKVSGKEVADKPNTNPMASLQGKVAGLSVVNSGTPGRAPDIRIRGTVSIGQVQPLYVVDGIFNDNIDYINPNDIESIEVLKDPSSLAIFGVKGATGVIAITTKKARAGQVVVNFNTSYGFKKLVDKIKLVNAAQFAELFAEERAGDASNPTTVPFDYSGLTANTDWIDAVTRTGKFSNSNLSIAGSTEKNRFNFGMGYQYDEGIVRREKLDKWLLSLADEFKISNAIKIGLNLNISRQNNPYDATWVLDAARKVIPQVSATTMPFRVRNPYGVDTLDVNLYSGLDVGLQSSGVVNPLIQLENEWDKRKSIELRTVGSVYAEIAFLKKFTFRSTLYADQSNINTRTYTPLYYAYNPKNNTPYPYTQSTRVTENDDNYRKFQQDHVLNYKTRFGDHNLTLTGGFTTYYFGNFNRNGTSAQASGPSALPIPNNERFWYINNGFQDPTNTSANSSQSEYSTMSYLARGLYNYKNKYFLNASFRNDASSRLPEANRDQQFWAVGAAWDLTKESFMESQNIFDFLKLKGSIGVLGNQTASRLDGTPLNYPFYPSLLTGSDANAVFGTNVYTAARPEYEPNPNLKWETVNAKEIGVELNAFKNRLHFEGNYFDRTTNDLLTYVSRQSIGLPDELINGGSIKNSGVELTASWVQNFTQDLVLNIGGNITFLKNEVISLNEDLPTGYLARGFQNNGSAESRTQPGLPIGSFYGYVVEGLYQSYADIAKSPNAGALGAYRPGNFKFKDVNGDGIISADDRTVIGNPTPDFTYGGSINLAFKGLTLGVDLVGVYGNEVFRTWGSLESPFQRVSYSAEKLERWHGPGTSNWVPNLGQGDRFNYNGSTYNIEDGSYFRIRNLQLGYNFNQKALSGIKVKNLRVYANVQNLKTFKNNLGYTPEFGGDATAFGYDNAGGAIPMVTTFGLNLTF
ncbi:MAG: TonB-dependent receptor [Ferruginibacter sp.]|nr:TonB-dependent receptor [Ferruginibacter sp.]